MFFPKLRRQAKWVFIFLALSFAVGFVVFGVGSGGGAGLGDLLQGGGGGSSGPSVSDAQGKIKKGDLVAYKELADAYRQDGKVDQAISAGEQYLKVRPNDYDYMRTVAGDYEGRASRQRDQATVIQDEVTSSTGGTTFASGKLAARARASARQDRHGAADLGQPEADAALRGPPGLVRACDPALPAARGAHAERRPAPAPARERRAPVPQQPGGAQGLPQGDQALTRQRRGRAGPPGDPVPEVAAAVGLERAW